MRQLLSSVALLLVGAWTVSVSAEPVGCAVPNLAESKSHEKVWRYKPNQLCPPRPKLDYTDEGRAIMIKRYPYFTEQGWCQFMKYSFFENKQGVEHFQKGCKLKREPDDILSEEQKAILKEWGQPDYLRGPYKSTRGDSVIEWAYHPLNHLFQFVDRTMVYEGPLTDQERTAMVYGAPRDAIVSILDPNIRRETWFYKSRFLFGREQVYSFSNGKLIYEQTSY